MNNKTNTPRPTINLTNGPFSTPGNPLCAPQQLHPSSSPTRVTATVNNFVYGSLNFCYFLTAYMYL